MKTMIRVVLVSVALAAAVLGLGGTANASHTKLEVKAPSSQLTVGDSVDVQAVLHSADDGLPIAEATVTFYMEASFAGVDGEVLLGQTVTDANGVADLDYQPRSAGAHQLRVEYLTPGATVSEEAFWSHSVAGATEQVYQSKAGVQVPGLNVWLIIALVATVWSLLFSVGLRVFSIARANGDGRNDHGTGRAVSADLGGRGA
jgi:hypothetical protein